MKWRAIEDSMRGKTFTLSTGHRAITNERSLKMRSPRPIGGRVSLNDGRLEPQTEGFKQQFRQIWRYGAPNPNPLFLHRLTLSPTVPTPIHKLTYWHRCVPDTGACFVAKIGLTRVLWLVVGLLSVARGVVMRSFSVPQRCRGVDKMGGGGGILFEASRSMRRRARPG